MFVITVAIAHIVKHGIPAWVKSPRAHSVVPPGLASSSPLFPVLKRWAKLDRPSGAGSCGPRPTGSHEEPVFTHTLKRYATQDRARDQVFQHSVRLGSCNAPRLQRRRPDSGQQILDLPSKGRKP